MAYDWANYIYRRNLAISAPDDVPAWHPVTVNLTPILRTNGKTLSSYEDIEVGYKVAEADIQPLYRVIEEDPDGSINITFQLQEDLVANELLEDLYFVYYGNLFLVDPPVRPVPTYPDNAIYSGDFAMHSLWPLSVDHSHTMLSYTRPGEQWEDGVSSHRGARASLRTYATNMRIISFRDLNAGIAEVQIDGGAWVESDIFATTNSVEPVFEVLNLSGYETHEMRIRVSGRRQPASQDDKINIERVEYRKPVECVDLGEEVNGLSWTSSVGGN